MCDQKFSCDDRRTCKQNGDSRLAPFLNLNPSQSSLTNAHLQGSQGLAGHYQQFCCCHLCLTEFVAICSYFIKMADTKMKVLITNDCHIAQTSYRKKKRNVNTRKTKSSRFSPTDCHWADTVNWEGTEPKWRKMLKMHSQWLSQKWGTNRDFKVV